MMRKLFASARSALPGSETRMSVVVVAYNMVRELPRTIETLSARMQRGLVSEDYEIIVVDNGSRRPFDRQQVLSYGNNISIIDVPDPNVSPARAINLAVSQARFPLIGVLIDGARMASPGLLAAARDALSLGQDRVVGTFGFHLGHKIQMEAVFDGYDEAVEDRLLNTLDWRKDAYSLFEISVFAGSSAKGWFALPEETNALFLHRSRFDSLGGFDARFVLPGGGLVNHDFWTRACAAEASRVVMLLGEGTFHQFHGGVATNARTSPWASFAAEYRSVTGKDYAPVSAAFTLYGALAPQARRHLLKSLGDIPVLSSLDGAPG